MLFKTYLLQMEKHKTTVKNSILKIIPPTWNEESELTDGSYSVPEIYNYIECIIKNMKHYPLILPFIFISAELIIG